MIDERRMLLDATSAAAGKLIEAGNRLAIIAGAVHASWGDRLGDETAAMLLDATQDWHTRSAELAAAAIDLGSKAGL